MSSEPELNVAQTAAIIGCHRNTILKYESRGWIFSTRDRNNFRRFKLSDVLKLAKFVHSRTDAKHDD